MASSPSKYQVYVSWARSVLRETGRDVEATALQNPDTLAVLIDTLWPAAKLSDKLKSQTSDEVEAGLQLVLDYLSSLGVSHNLTPSDLTSDDPRKSLDLAWLLILHLCVHSPRVSAFQRNVRMGVRGILNWCREQVPSMTVIHTETLVSNLRRDCVLIDLVTKICVGIKHNTDTVTHLENCLKAADEQLGVKKTILDAEAFLQGKTTEESLLVYMSLLKRKVKQRESVLAISSSPQRSLDSRDSLLPSQARLAWTI